MTGPAAASGISVEAHGTIVVTPIDQLAPQGPATAEHRATDVVIALEAARDEIAGEVERRAREVLGPGWQTVAVFACAERGHAFALRASAVPVPTDGAAAVSAADAISGRRSAARELDGAWPRIAHDAIRGAIERRATRRGAWHVEIAMADPHPAAVTTGPARGEPLAAPGRHGTHDGGISGATGRAGWPRWLATALGLATIAFWAALYWINT